MSLRVISRQRERESLKTPNRGRMPSGKDVDSLPSKYLLE